MKPRYTPLPASARKARGAEEADHRAFLIWFDGDDWNPFDWDATGDIGKAWADHLMFGAVRFSHKYDARPTCS